VVGLAGDHFERDEKCQIMRDMVPKKSPWGGVTVYCCGDVKTSGGVDDLSLDDPLVADPGRVEKNYWVGLYIFGMPIARKVSGALGTWNLAQ
jgi:hypothetical protein